MRLEEANIFLKAFNNGEANNFVQRLLKNNYAEAIIEHHPDAASVDENLIRKKCNQLVELIFQRIEQVKDIPDNLFPLFYRLSRNNQDDNSIWFKEFEEAYHNYKHNRKLNNRLKQLKPFLHGVSYCDIGCGGGDLIVFIKRNFSQFKGYAGIDVLDWRTDSYKDEINFQMLDFSKPATKSSFKYDTLTCLAVLHHVGNKDEEISIFLNNIHTAINPNGRLIIEEDVVLPEYQVNMNNDYRMQLEILSKRQPLFSEFLAFEEEKQRAAIILIDFLANTLSVGVPDMAFPCGFRTINEWTEIFEKNNFKVEDVRIQGFVKGNFNRSSHAFFILTPN